METGKRSRWGKKIKTLLIFRFRHRLFILAKRTKVKNKIFGSSAQIDWTNQLDFSIPKFPLFPILYYDAAVEKNFFIRNRLKLSFRGIEITSSFAIEFEITRNENKPKQISSVFEKI